MALEKEPPVEEDVGTLEEDSLDDIPDMEFDEVGEIIKAEREYIPGYEKKVSKAVNTFVWVGVFGVLVMLCITTFDVIARTFLGFSVPGVYEYSKFLMVLVIAVALPYTSLIDGHVEVDMIVSRLPKIPKKILYFFNFAIVLGYCVLLIVSNWTQAGATKAMGLKSVELMWIQLYPFYYIISIGMIFMFVIILMKAVNYARGIK